MEHKELELLVSLQDIDLMIEESEDVQKLGFSITGCNELKIARQEIADKIKKPLIYRYERLRSKLKRAIVPVKNDICLGCFLRQPTSIGAQGREGSEIFTCENCGRMLYWLD